MSNQLGTYRHSAIRKRTFDFQGVGQDFDCPGSFFFGCSSLFFMVVF